MAKIDLKKELKHLYLPPVNQVTLVDVPLFKFVCIDGQIEPDASPASSADFHQAMTALYGLSYTLKFMSKQRPVNPVDYTVMALEGLWWVESGQFEFDPDETWLFRLMILQPDHITDEMFREALEHLSQKQPGPALARLRFIQFCEGLCMQMMHIGPYADEPHNLARMRQFAQENGYAYRGKHHEIYIGDPRRAKPEKLKTVLRQPVEKLGHN